MASKWKKKLKNVGKMAALAAAAYGASKLGKKRKSVVDTAAMEDIITKPPRVDDYNYTPKKKLPFSPTDMWDNPWGAKGGGIAKRGTGAAFKSGGRVKSMGIAKRGGGAAKR